LRSKNLKINFVSHPPINIVSGAKKSKKLKNSKLVIYFMYHILKILHNCFLNFIVQKVNYKMVKCEMVVLIETEKTGVADTDVDVS
jgi:hypothetical protein